MRSVQRTVDYKPVYRTTYVADDGMEFYTEEECRNYEATFPEIDQYRVYDLDQMRPIDIDGLTSDCSDYIWYHLKSIEDIEKLVKFFGNNIEGERLNKPGLICIENGIPYKSAYAYTESTMMKDTLHFWEKLGYKIIFTPTDETEEDDIKKGE